MGSGGSCFVVVVVVVVVVRPVRQTRVCVKKQAESRKKNETADDGGGCVSPRPTARLFSDKTVPRAPSTFDPFQKWGFCPLFSSASSDSDARPARLPREILLFLRSCVHPENRRGTAGKLGGLGGLDSKAPQPGFSCYLRSQVMTSLGS